MNTTLATFRARSRGLAWAAAIAAAAAGCAGLPDPPPDPPALAHLTVVVIGALPGGGPVRCGVYAERASFLKAGGLLTGKSAEPDGAIAEFAFEIAAPSTVAISVFQDQDRDGDLDRGWLGIPTEPWGFSGKPASLGPPTWDACAIPLRPGANRIEIVLSGGDRKPGG